MSRRIFPVNDAWTSEASRAANNINVALVDLLAILEEDGPVDLKDFHYLVTQVAGTFVTGLSITRRLGDPSEPPDPIVRVYPRLTPSYDDDDGTYECSDCGRTSTEEACEEGDLWQSTTLCSACGENQKDRIYTQGYATWT